MTSGSLWTVVPSNEHIPLEYISQSHQIPQTDKKNTPKVLMKTITSAVLSHELTYIQKYNISSSGFMTTSLVPKVKGKHLIASLCHFLLSSCETKISNKASWQKSLPWMQMEMLNTEYPKECRHWIRNYSDAFYWAQGSCKMGSICFIKTSMNAYIGQKKCVVIF